MNRAGLKQVKRTETATQMAKDRKYILSLYKADGVPADFDLADDRQYNFLLNLRGGSEYLKNYFPHNYRLLENARQRAVEEKRSKTKPASRHKTLLEKVAGGENFTGWQDNVQIIGFVAETQNAAQYKLATTGLVGFVDGLEEMNATLEIFNSNTGDIIASNSMENLLQNGYDTIITTFGVTGSLEGVEAYLLVDYLPYNSATKESKIVKIQLLDKIDPSSPIQVDDPVHRAVRANSGFIKICMGRRDSDCDYNYTAQPAPKTPIPNVTVKGNVSFPGPITDPAAGPDTFGALFFVKRREGGSAQLFADYGQIYKYFKVNGDNISWDFEPATFEKDAPWTQGNEVDLNLTVQVSVNGQPKNGQFQITSLKGVPEGKSIAKIDVLRFFWGCLSADSKVLMQDNTQKRIDSIKAGEMVQTDIPGQYLKVFDIVTGEEEKPCLRIVTENKRSLLVTDEHPVCRLDGFCLAEELRVGDFIKTQSGPEKVLSITKERYDGTIYNLKLTAEQDSAVNEAVHYANGILVGDGNMQGALLEKRKQQAGRIPSIEELPEVWRFDAENAKRLREGKTLIPVLG